MATIPISSFIFILAVILSPLLPPSSATDWVIYSDPPTALISGQNFTYDLRLQGYPFLPYWLILSDDCNLGVKNVSGELEWSTNTFGAGEDCYLTVDSYGEALLQSNLHYPTWRSNVRAAASGNYIFLLEANGGVATYGPTIWSSDNSPYFSNTKYYEETTDYVVYAYSVFPVNMIVANYKNLQLYLHPNCNLALTDLDTGKVIWQTGTSSAYGDCFFTVDDYGELFLKHRRRQILWRSGKTGSSPGLYALVLRYDGKLVVYGPRLWGTKSLWAEKAVAA